MTDAGGIAERAFFREEFRRRTVVIALRADDPAALVDAVPVISELVVGESRVLVVVDAALLDASRLAERLALEPQPPPATSDELAELWTVVSDTGLGIVTVDGDPAFQAADLPRRLGVSKLVLTDPAGGWDRSFASASDLASARAARATVAEAAHLALQGGVDGVNLCRIADLDTELFTFDGAGTLFTAEAYVRVTPLGADDLPVVEQLVARGVAEGFLRPRSRHEVVRLAFGGLGARVGFSGHLAGIGTLETDRYAADDVAEVVCLYTVNRYSGEGVGRRLVEGLVDAARAGSARAVFACTVSDRAAALFERSGFTPVGHDRVPAAKWADYDAERRARLAVHWRDLSPAAATPTRPRATATVLGSSPIVSTEVP